MVKTFSGSNVLLGLDPEVVSDVRLKSRIGEMQAKTECFTQSCQYRILSLAHKIPKQIILKNLLQKTLLLSLCIVNFLQTRKIEGK